MPRILVYFTLTTVMLVVGMAAEAGTTWTDRVNVTVNGDSIEKTSGCDGCEDAGAASVETLSSGDGFVEFTVSETTTSRIIGLSHGNTGTGRADIDFGIQLWAGGGADVRENGTYRAESGPYASGDVFRIAVESGVVNYYKNGTRFYTSSIAPAYPLLVDTTLWNISATVSGVVIVGSGAGSARIEETDPAVSYGGTWVNRGAEVASFSGDSAVSSDAAGADATLTFSGTSVSWIGLRCNVCGIAQVSVDGGAATAVDTAGPDAPGSAGLSSEVVFTSPVLADGTHTLTVTVSANTNSGGDNIIVDAFEVEGGGGGAPSDTAAPSVAITAPADGTTVSGIITVAADASDDTGVAGVQFNVDGTAIGTEDTASPYEVSWDTTTAADGSHSLTAMARDAAGNTTTSAAVSITVDNGGSASSGVELMPASEAGWQVFSARPETMPSTSVWYNSSDYVLNIYGNGVPNVYGGWRTSIDGLQGGQSYRFRARAWGNIESVRESVTILLRWRGDFGDEVSPDYIWDYQQLTDGTIYFDRTIQAPAGSRGVDVELVLQWAETGELDISELSFQAVALPPPRPVRVAAIYFRPSGSVSGADSVQQAADYGRQVAAQYSPDIMVFGELLNVVGAPGSMDDKAEPIPGTSTEIMSALARDYGVNVVVGLLESSNEQLYNAAVLFDRNGDILGKYHKVQLPLQDASAGIAPGNAVPVFDTDVGRVAMLICHDIAFPEPAREVALQGAEIILLPIWGHKTAYVRTRALENSAYVVSSGYDYASDVVNPLGEVLDRITTLYGGAQVAIADIDLNRRFREDWLGDWRDISNKERRTQPYIYEVP